MDLIYTDTKGKELGVVYTTLDMEIGEEATNDFEIEYKRSEWDGTVENGWVLCSGNRVWRHSPGNKNQHKDEYHYGERIYLAWNDDEKDH